MGAGARRRLIGLPTVSNHLAMSNDSDSLAQHRWHEQAAAQDADRHRQVQREWTPNSGRLAGREGPSLCEPDFKFKLLADWQLVKRARFQAADRLDRRNGASLFTLSTVALYGGLVTVFVLIFKDSLTPHARNVCDWVSAVANWLTLTFSLTEQIKDYSGQSRALHECAQKVNDLRKRLQATPISAPQQLIPFVQAYDSIISECGPNHAPIDYEIARCAGSRKPSAATSLRRLKRWSMTTTYAIYVVMCLAPALAGLLAWALVPPVPVPPVPVP